MYLASGPGTESRRWQTFGSSGRHFLLGKPLDLEA